MYQYNFTVFSTNHYDASEFLNIKNAYMMVESPSSPPPGSPNAAAAAVRVLLRPPEKPDPAGSGFNSPGVERGESLGERSCTTHVSTHFGYRGPSFRKACAPPPPFCQGRNSAGGFSFLFQLRVSFISFGLYAKLWGINWGFILREELLAKRVAPTY